MFSVSPHYHYEPRGEPERVLMLDTDAEGDPVEWGIAKLRNRLTPMVQSLIEAEYAALGASPKYAPADIAAMSLALFGGFGLDRLVDPRSVSTDTLDATLTILFDALIEG